MRRHRNVKIVATLGPASETYETIRALHEAGADVFRLNMSHGTHEGIREKHAIIRRIEEEMDSPIAILADLQGPKLRVGAFANGEEELEEGATFRLDMDETPGTIDRVCLPHIEIFAALEPGATLLVNDGKIRLKVTECGPDFAQTEVITGGTISDRKGVNVPDVVLPLKALTDKDREDLEFACELGVDWLALSFVQRPEDVVEARDLVKGRAAIMVKIEKPAAVTDFDAIGIDVRHFASLLGTHNHGTVGGHFFFHTRSNDRRLGNEQWYSLPLHIRTHECAVRIIVLKERNHTRSD